MEENEIGDKQEKRAERLKKKKKFQKIKNELLKSAECSKCHQPIPELLQSSDFEPLRIDGKQVCRDCWCRELGDEIEKRPICSPRHFALAGGDEN